MPPGVRSRIDRGRFEAVEEPITTLGKRGRRPVERHREAAHGGSRQKSAPFHPHLPLFATDARALRVRQIDRINDPRSEEHTSELQSLMRISYAVFCLKKKKTNHISKEIDLLSNIRYQKIQKAEVRATL